MGILDKLVGAAATPAITAVGSVIEKVYEGKSAKLSHQEIMAELAMRPDLAQVELNKIEANHRSLLVAGWRPFIGWVCGLGLLFPFIINPTIQWLTAQPGPVLPVEDLTALVYALLGLGALRTAEKMTGRAK